MTRVWSPERDVRRPVAVSIWTLVFWLGYLPAIGGIFAWVAIENLRPIPEVDMQAVEVQVDDPFPCTDDPRIRLAMQKLGAVCSPWPPP